MIRLHPLPDVAQACPGCGVPLEVRGWYMPGMRCLADLRCDGCGRTFYGDLPVGGGLIYPMLLDQRSGAVHDRWNVPWFARWLSDSYGSRVDKPIEFVAEQIAPLHQPVLLNCLDTLYGHCLLKLLNAQFYLDQHTEADLIVLVPRFLRWLVPDGVAAVWTVDLPLGRRTQWNDWLAKEIHRRVADLGACWLSIACSHPHPRDYDIERFSGVTPFPTNDWTGPPACPAVTFIWRDDRCWTNGQPQRNDAAARGYQTANVVRFAEVLRSKWPALDFAVAGCGEPGGFPDWIDDLRRSSIDLATEREWCRRYAASHLVVGVHGSNMLLPSAHAGAVLDLMPANRWANAGQDLLLRGTEPREMIGRYRLLPESMEPDALAGVADSMLRFHGEWAHQMWGDACRHRSIDDGQAGSNQPAAVGATVRTMPRSRSMA
ncbi:MAG: hypothetical protein GY778_07860 [bacterium]|nr:hypothetical protein [bacterium]